MNVEGILGGGRTLDDFGLVVDLPESSSTMALRGRINTVSSLEWDWLVGKRSGELAEEAWALLRSWTVELDVILAHD